MPPYTQALLIINKNKSVTGSKKFSINGLPLIPERETLLKNTPEEVKIPSCFNDPIVFNEVNKLLLRHLRLYASFPFLLNIEECINMRDQIHEEMKARDESLQSYI